MSKKCTGENILTLYGCKHTKSRKAILDILLESDAALSAEDIFLRLKEKGILANLSTVYRTIELFESKGFVHKAIMDGMKARFSIAGDGHKHHLICTDCRKMVPIDYCPFESIQKDVGERTNFDITGHKLELYGICPECKKN